MNSRPKNIKNTVAKRNEEKLPGARTCDAGFCCSHDIEDHQVVLYCGLRREDTYL